MDSKKHNNMSKRITITIKSFINNRLFDVNSQYIYDSKVGKTTGCKCNGSLKESFYYRVMIDGVVYDIPEDHAALSTDIELPVGDESDFKDRLANIGWTSRIDDFDGLVSKPNPDEIWKNAQDVPM